MNGVSHTGLAHVPRRHAHALQGLGPAAALHRAGRPALQSHPVAVVAVHGLGVQRSLDHLSVGTERLVALLPESQVVQVPEIALHEGLLVDLVLVRH